MKACKCGRLIQDSPNVNECSSCSKMAVDQLVGQLEAELAEALETIKRDRCGYIRETERHIEIEEQNAEFKRQIAAGELVPVDVVRDWYNYTSGALPKNESGFPVGFKTLQQFAAQRQKEGRE